MNNEKFFSAFSYLSVLVAPFLVPIIIYFISRDADVKKHSLRALISHIIPVVLGFILFITFIWISFSSTGETLFAIWIAGFICYVLLYIAILIWNIIQAIKVLR